MTIRHGFLSQQDADNISESMERSLDNTRRLNGLQPMTIEIIPAKITGGASGVHAWTRQTIDATGGRVDDPAAFTGLVSGVSSATVTFQPARMPDGTTLSTYPTYAWIRPIGLAQATGPNFEILAITAQSTGVSSGGVSVITTMTSSTSTTAAAFNNSSIQILRFVFSSSTPGAGLYQIYNHVGCQAVSTNSTDTISLDISYSPDVGTSGLTLYTPLSSYNAGFGKVGPNKEYFSSSYHSIFFELTNSANGAITFLYGNWGSCSGTVSVNANVNAVLVRLRSD